MRNIFGTSVGYSEWENNKAIKEKLSFDSKHKQTKKN